MEVLACPGGGQGEQEEGVEHLGEKKLRNVGEKKMGSPGPGGRVPSKAQPLLPPIPPTPSSAFLQSNKINQGLVLFC